MPLTDVAIKNIKPKEKNIKLFDGGGLFLLITPAGNKWWRLKYRIAGKEKLFALGVYPEVSLKEAREKRDEARKLIKKDIDPCAQRQADKLALKEKYENTFEHVALEWLASHGKNLAPEHTKRVRSLFDRVAFPLFGGKPIADVEHADLLKAARNVEASGAAATARKLIQFCGQVFRYGIATNRLKYDISSSLRGAIGKTITQHMATLTDRKRIGELLRAIDSYEGYFPLRSALQLAPLVFVRPGELQKAEWSEFDLELSEWRIPAEKMKMKQQHIVPLSRQSLGILEKLRPFTGAGRFLFPSIRTTAKPVAAESLLIAIRSVGFTKEEMTMHGFRGMASTILNEQGYNRDWIERQLAHSERNSVRAAYNYAEFLPERRKMMQEWADYLDGLRTTTS